MPTPQTPIDTIIKRWPETIPVFLAYGMNCVGCAMTSFETLEEVLKNYGVAIEPFIKALNQSIIEATA